MTKNKKIISTSEELEGNMDNNNIVTQFLNQTTVKNEISIHRDEDRSVVVENVSHLQWQCILIYLIYPFSIIYIYDIVKFL